MNRLEEIFSFSESYPLMFTQVNFWIFFAIVYFIFALVYQKISLRNWITETIISEGKKEEPVSTQPYLSTSPLKKADLFVQ